MLEASFVRTMRLGKIFFTLILCGCAAFFVVKSIHWHWMFDESVFHYINFLMDRGKAPYRDIIDINMPGAYFIDGWAIWVFGTGDLGWRMYEYLLLTLLVAAMIVIARPYDWFAGVLGGGLFVLVHALDGPQMATERDEIMTVLIVAGYAFLFSALRRRRPLLMAPAGFLLGLAGSVKPTAVPLGLVLLGMAAFALWREKRAVGAYLSSGLVGMGLAGVVIAGFFVRTRSFPAFLGLMRGIVPYYVSLAPVPYSVLFGLLINKWMAVLCLLAVTAIWMNPERKNWERWALAVGVGFGVVSYFAQDKGTAYHRYPFFAFLFLWVSIEFVSAIKRQDWSRNFGVAGVLFAMLLAVPTCMIRLHRAPNTIDLPDALEADLTRLGGAAKLQNSVECLDTVSGCVAALGRLHLVETQPYMGDSLFFPVEGAVRSLYWSDLFWKQIHENPPKVLIITTEMMTGGGRMGRFDKLKQWPEFEDFLDRNYRVETTRRFGENDFMTAYRIYVLKGDRMRVGELTTPR